MKLLEALIPVALSQIASVPIADKRHFCQLLNALTAAYLEEDRETLAFLIESQLDWPKDWKRLLLEGLNANPGERAGAFRGPNGQR
jgi:hypothetical protein